MSKLKKSTLSVGGFLDEFEKDQIKKDVDIVSLFTSFGIKLEKKGKNYMGFCPFHEEKTPSLSVNREKGLYQCFGCGEAGDIFTFVMKKKGFDFPEALNYFKKDSFTSSKSLESPTPKIQQGKESITETKVVNPDVQSIIEGHSLNNIAEYYHGKLFHYPEAAGYLKTRKLLKLELLNRLKVGYSSGDLRSKVSETQYKELKEVGIFTEKGREAFEGCIVFPLFDESGNVVSLYGRKVSDKSKIKHLYLKGSHKGLFNGEAFKVYKERIIFTECIIDALSLMVMGVMNVVPLYGTNGITDDHLKALKDNRTKEIILALDNDKAGKLASEKLSIQFNELGYPVRIIQPLELKDWNEVLQTSPLSSSDITSFIEKAPVLSAKEKNSIDVEIQDGKYYFTFADITYRLIGVKEGFVSTLKVNVRAEKGEEKHIDNVDLFSARSRSSFSIVLGRMFGVETARVEKDLVSMLEWLENDRDKNLLGLDEDEAITLTAEEEKIGLELLKDPKLFDRIESDLSALGYVGEACNKKLMYLAASSRKLKDPISIIVISQSAAGKSYLIDTVKKLIPPEDVLSMTSLSDQALNYLPEEALLHKFLIMGEAVHSDAVDHQMREMLSAQELSRLVTTKDDKTGRMVSKLVRKKAIVSAVMSSATGEINPENASRCFVISTDESEEQTKAIHRQQRKKYSLERFETKADQLPSIVKAHHCAQRLLKERMIINPFADYLDFPATLMRSRRDHERFIDLIASVCFIRQYQKEEQQGVRSDTYIECDLTDYSIAYEIMMNILPSTLSNFPKSAQLLYEAVREILKNKAEEDKLQVHEVSLTQREIRELAGLEHNFVKRNIRLLVEYEYLNQKGGQNRGGRAHYRLNQDAALSLFDLSVIPKPEDMEKWVKSGSHSKDDLILDIVKK